MKMLTLTILIVLYLDCFETAGYPNCGVDVSKRPTEQVAGSTTSSIQNPWTIVMIKKDNSVYCTGSILTRNLILTAAHCFAKKRRQLKKNLRIVYGIGDLNLLDLPIRKTIRKIKKVKVHPNYKWPNAYSDVAILEVNRKVDFGQDIYPVCLPDRKNVFKNHLNEKSVKIVGFGPQNEDSKTMKEMRQKVQSYDYCNKEHSSENDKLEAELRQVVSSTFPRGFDETLICTQNWGSIGGTCKGDSGGPLLTTVKKGQETYMKQVGVLHGSLKDCSNEEYPAIYTRLDSPNVYNWLKRQIKDPNFWSKPKPIVPAILEEVAVGGVETIVGGLDFARGVIDFVG